MNRGYVKVWRKIDDSGIVGNADLCQLLLYLMVKASHRPRKIAVGAQVVELQPGELFAGRKQLASALGSTEQRVRTALSSLQKCGIINQQATSRGSVISLINWDKYQCEQPASNQQLTNEQPASNQQLTNEQPASNQQLTTKQALKNLRIKEFKNTQDACARVDRLSASEAEPEAAPEIEPERIDPPRKEPLAPGQASPEYSFEFEELWDQYPRKEGKGVAWQAFKVAKAQHSYPGNPIALPLLVAWRASPAWQNDGGRFVPSLSRWIRERRWDDGQPEDPRERLAKQVADTLAMQAANDEVRQ